MCYKDTLQINKIQISQINNYTYISITKKDFSKNKICMYINTKIHEYNKNICFIG